MHVYEWFSYSCNNSSDHRLVAEFESEARAHAMADELRALFVAHAKQVDMAMYGPASDDAGEEIEDWEDDEEVTPALRAFARKYGAEMGEGITWGDGDRYVHDLPEVVALGRSLYVYHAYMGGFGDLSGVLESAGAVRAENDHGPACLQFTVTTEPGETTSMRRALDRWFSQRETTESLGDWVCAWKYGLPPYRKLENVVLVHRGERSIFTVAIDAKWVDELVDWLESLGGVVEAKLPSAAEIAELRAAEGATAPARYTSRVLHRELAEEPVASWETVITTIHVDGPRVVLCGGGGKNLLRVSDDGGRTFRSQHVGVGTGLRGYLQDARAVYVCGQSGLLARSVSGGVFHRVDTGATKCAQTILRADGALWQTGDSGVFFSTDDGASWAKLEDVEGEVSRARDSALGLLLPTSTGRLYLRRGGALRPTALQAGAAMWAACVPRGHALCRRQGAYLALDRRRRIVRLRRHGQRLVREPRVHGLWTPGRRERARLHSALGRRWRDLSAGRTRTHHQLAVCLDRLWRARVGGWNGRLGARSGARSGQGELMAASKKSAARAPATTTKRARMSGGVMSSGGDLYLILPRDPTDEGESVLAWGRANDDPLVVTPISSLLEVRSLIATRGAWTEQADAVALGADGEVLSLKEGHVLVEHVRGPKPKGKRRPFLGHMTRLQQVDETLFALGYGGQAYARSLEESWRPVASAAPSLPGYEICFYGVVSTNLGAVFVGSNVGGTRQILESSRRPRRPVIRRAMPIC